METILEKLCTQEKAIAALGTTVAQTDQLLTDLEMLETTAEVKIKYLTIYYVLSILSISFQQDNSSAQKLSCG